MHLLVYHSQLLLLLECSLSKGVWGKEFDRWTSEKLSHDRLVYGGQEGTDEFPTYICRARVSPSGHYDPNGQFLPGKFVPSYYNYCYIATQLKELNVPKFDLLVDSDYEGTSPYKWKSSRNKSSTRNPVVVGTFYGSLVYICRTKHTPVRKWFWTGHADLVGHSIGGKDCRASWDGSAELYDDFDILIDRRPLCTPTEEWVVLHDFKNTGNSDQTVHKEYNIGVEDKRDSSHSFSDVKTISTEIGATVGGNVEGVRAEFSAKLGTSQTTGYRWSGSASRIWRKSTTNSYPFFVKAGTHGILKHLVGRCGDVEVATEKLVATSETL